MKIAFLGDSITLGYGLERKEDRYASLICRQIGATEANFGITGTLMARAGMNREDGNSFLDRLHLLEDADLVVIFGGTNDYFWSDSPIGNEDSGEDYFAGAVEEICQKISEIRDKKTILLVTPYSHNGIGNYDGGLHFQDASRHDTTEKNYHGHCLEEYADVLIKAAGRHNIAVLNLHECSGFEWKEHTLDGCHPNEEGHKWLAEQIGQSINAMCGSV